MNKIYILFLVIVEENDYFVFDFFFIVLGMVDNLVNKFGNVYFVGVDFLFSIYMYFYFLIC